MSESKWTRWKAYRPRKRAVAWGFVAGAVTAVVVGFWAFDWYTAGGAAAMARHAAHDARIKMASAVCVDRFMKAPDAAEQLAALKDASSYSRDRFIEKGGWVTFASLDVPVYDAAEPCANTLLQMEMPKADKSASSES